MSHLIVHVLPEAKFIFGDTHFGEVEVDPPDEISQDGVIDHSLHETQNRNQFQCCLLGGETTTLTKADST